jgi:tetratricopeptide (TPR) repeat protein
MKKKGFGKSQPSIKYQKGFIRAFIKCFSNKEKSLEQASNFLKRNSKKLNEELLELLPAIFDSFLKETILQDEQKAVALGFCWLGSVMNLIDFKLHDVTLQQEFTIVCYQLATKIFIFKNFTGDSKRFSIDWGELQYGLGELYTTRLRGEVVENIETAIYYNLEALRVYNEPSEKWAIVQGGLSHAYLYRVKGERTENLERSIYYAKLALDCPNLKKNSHGWAMITSNLAVSYRNRIKGDREENLELAIDYYHKALTFFTFNNDPIRWSMVKNNLGNIYDDRIKGNPRENIEQAIIYFNEAFKVRTIENYPNSWAQTNCNLARVLIKRADLFNNPSDLDTAIEKLTGSLKYFFPVNIRGYGDCQYQLGTAFLRRYEKSKNIDDLERSKEAYTIARNSISPEHYDYRQYWQAIPATQAILGSRLVRDGNWQEGLKLLINSLNQLKTGDNSLVYANALYQTGYAYELLSDQENARLYYRDALRLYEHLQDLPGIATSRESLGNVFVSQGHLEKGMSELAQAREIYQQLGRTEAAEKVDNTYQSVQQVLEQVKSEVLA